MRIQLSDKLRNPRLLFWKILQKRLSNAPETIIHLIRGAFFYYFVVSLLKRYFEFETDVLIRYVLPEQTRFPAFTICGCSLISSICGDLSNIQSYNDSIKKTPISSLFLNNMTLQEKSLIPICYFVNDSRHPNVRIPCSDIEHVVESMHDDRKCFTYLSILHDSISAGQRPLTTNNEEEDDELGDSMNFFVYDEYDNDGLSTPEKDKRWQATTAATKSTSTTPMTRGRTMTMTTVVSTTTTTTPTTTKKAHNSFIAEVSEHFTSYIRLEINFSQTTRREHVKKSRVQNADIVFSVHSDIHLPTLLDTNFQRLLPGFDYDIIFGKQITEFKTAPYKTNCHAYQKYQKPRSRNECVRLCIIMASLKQFGCLNIQALITPCWISHVEKINGLKSINRTVFCNENKIGSFLNYLKLRRQCTVQCARDCIEENFDISIEMTPFDGKLNLRLIDNIATPIGHIEQYDQLKRQAAQNMSVITIRSNRKPIESIKHHTELTLIELVGFLGGHAHIWLGISFISVYDIFAHYFNRLKQFLRANVIV